MLSFAPFFNAGIIQVALVICTRCNPNEVLKQTQKPSEAYRPILSSKRTARTSHLMSWRSQGCTLHIGHPLCAGSDRHIHCSPHPPCMYRGYIGNSHRGSSPCCTPQPRTGLNVNRLQSLQLGWNDLTYLKTQDSVPHRHIILNKSSLHWFSAVRASCGKHSWHRSPELDWSHGRSLQNATLSPRLNRIPQAPTKHRPGKPDGSKNLPNPSGLGPRCRSRGCRCHSSKWILDCTRYIPAHGPAVIESGAETIRRMKLSWSCPVGMKPGHTYPGPHLEFARPKACKSCTPHQHLDCTHRPDTWSPSTRIQRCTHCTGCRYPGLSDPCKSCNWNFLQCCRDRLHRWSYWRGDIQSCTSRIGHHLGVNPVAVYKEKSTNKSSQLERRCSKHLKP